MKKTMAMLLAIMLLAATAFAAMAVEIPEITDDWFELEDGVLTVTLANEDGTWRYVGETSLGGAAEKTDEEVVPSEDDETVTLYTATFEGKTDGQTMLSFNLESGITLKQVNFLAVTIEDGVITHAEVSESGNALSDLMANLDLSALPGISGLPE